MDKKIYFAFLPERAVYVESLLVSNQIHYRAGVKGYIPLLAGYGRTDIVRQGICELFLEMSKEPDDTLVMFDIDHEHPLDTIERLVGHDKPVVAPLMFRRGAPFDACAFGKDANGDIHHLAQFGVGLKQMNGVGSGAVAIKRSVLTRLLELGHHWFWKYQYLDPEPAKFYGARAPSEDLYFSRICDEAGIEMYVDTDFESLHMLLGGIGRAEHTAYREAYPEQFGQMVTLGELHGGGNGTVETSESQSGYRDERLEQRRINRATNLVHSTEHARN